MIGIVFMVVAAAAPITVVAANFPIIISVSGSLGAPLMILVATVILLLFAVGFSWMTPHVPDAGAFYSYIDRGLGRRAGLGAASIALFSYVLLTVSMTCYLGVQTGNLIELWTGTSLPWWLISAVASTWVSIVTSAIVLVSAVLQLDPVMQIYTWYSGAGALGVIVMMTLTSFAVVGYGSKLRGVGEGRPVGDGDGGGRAGRRRPAAGAGHLGVELPRAGRRDGRRHRLGAGAGRRLRRRHARPEPGGHRDRGSGPAVGRGGIASPSRRGAQPGIPPAGRVGAQPAAHPGLPHPWSPPEVRRSPGDNH